MIEGFKGFLLRGNVIDLAVAVVIGAAQRGIPVEVYTLATMLFAVTVLAMLFVTWQQARAERMAQIRPDDEGDSGLAALASGRQPAGG